MKNILYLSLVCASISFTITETRVFQPLRAWLNRRNAFLGKLFSCGYCLGHWVAVGLVALVVLSGKLPAGGLLFHTRVWPLLDYFFSTLVIAWFSGIQWLGMCILMNKAGK